MTFKYWEATVKYLMETMNKMRRETEHTQRNTNGISGDEKCI